MKVLSLFDGISCAYVACQRAGFQVDKYYASEIDKSAKTISISRVPCRIDLGDVRTILSLDDRIDLLVGGSPCQDLSIAKKGRQGLAGNRSSLFYEYVRIKELVNPTWFILENVASMPKSDRDEITRVMGVEPILINASLVSAQCRKRLFWTNIPNIGQPEDRGILLKDILQPDAEVDERMVIKGKSFCLTATYSHANTTETGVRNSVERKQRTLVFTKTAQTGRNETKKLGYVGEHDHQAKRVYDDEGKAPALNVICNSMVKVGATPTLIQQDRIRKLTPIECERLQGLPDNYTEGIAMTNRYKCLGNAFNVEVVTHILNSIPKE